MHRCRTGWCLAGVGLLLAGVVILLCTSKSTGQTAGHVPPAPKTVFLAPAEDAQIRRDLREIQSQVDRLDRKLPPKK